jgi:hypothetical protein
VVVDLDLDGADEVLLGELVLSGGQVAFAAPTLTAIVFGVPLQVDKDPEMELAFASQDEVLFLDHDGALLGRSELPGSHPGPPCVGDFDGDGDPELVVPAVNRISMFEGDGTLVWSALAQDTSGLAGCSGFDFDRDGADEVVYADHEDLIILSGDGSVLSRWQGHHSFTIFETPVVADVDGDGAAEVCIGSNNGDFNGLSCLGHVDDAWPGTGSSWGRHDYAESGRVRTRAIVEDPSAPDLTGKLVDLCVDCSGDVELSVQAWNRGALALDGMTWGLYAMDLGSETLLDEGAFASGPVGEADASRVISFPAADLGQMGAVLVLDHEGVESECFEDNNRIEVLLSCP